MELSINEESKMVVEMIMESERLYTEIIRKFNEEASFDNWRAMREVKEAFEEQYGKLDEVYDVVALQELDATLERVIKQYEKRA